MTTANNLLIVLGAADPEMQAIENLLSQVGVAYAYATGQDGQRVHPGNAYLAVGAFTPDGKPVDIASISHTVECAIDGVAGAVVIDHHRPGDPGYGRLPAEYWQASSLGQVFHALAQGYGWFMNPEPGDAHFRGDPVSLITHGEEPDIYGIENAHLVAAADHCLAAAYGGQCPGVDPDELMKWRAESRAAFQGRAVEDVLADVEAARVILRESLTEAGYADLRGRSVPELPEAAAREGIPFLAQVTERDGREKIVLQAAPAPLVRRFLAGDLIPGLVNHYGDPARGFAGGYVA